MVNLIKNIFGDIFVLYKNFLHFNLSKVVIYLVSLLYTVAFALPFVLVLWWVYYYLLSSWNIALLSGNIFLAILIGLLVIIWVITAIIVFSYNYVLLTKLNLSYINWEKLKLKENYYLNFKLFFTYFRTMLLNFIIVLAPFVIGALLISLLIILSWGVEWARAFSESWALNFFTVTSFLIAIGSIIAFIYLMYKTLFTVVILVSESNGEKFNKAIYYIKKSFEFTSWFKRSFRFIVVAILVFLVTLPISIPLNYITFSNEKLSDYITSVISPESITNFYYVEELKAEFWEQDIEVLISELNKNSKYRLLLEALNFLLIFGLFEMMLVSFYKRELLWNKKISENNQAKLKDENIETKEVKKAPAKKAPAKKAPAKKAPAKKAPAKKAPVKKVPVKKVPVKKVPAKKVPVKKVPAKKVTTTKK